MIERKKCFSMVKLRVAIRRSWNDAIKIIDKKAANLIRDKLEKEKMEIHRRKVERFNGRVRSVLKDHNR
jgi:hypothetical protein